METEDLLAILLGYAVWALAALLTRSPVLSLLAGAAAVALGGAAAEAGRRRKG